MLLRGIFGAGQASGSIAGMTISRNRGGQYARNRSVPVNPKTPRQEAVRTGMSLANEQWKNLLTEAERQDWNTYAELTPLPNTFGEPNNVGGKQMYSRLVISRSSAGIGVPNGLAPATPGVGQSAIFTLTGDTTLGVEITLNTPTLAVGDFMYVRISPAVNQSVNFLGSPYTFVVALTSTTVYPLQIKAPGLVSIGQRYFVQGRIVTFLSRVSAITRLSTDILV